MIFFIKLSVIDYSGMMAENRRPYERKNERRVERREKFAYVLDYLREGNPLDKHKIHKNRPFAQLLGADYFMLMEASTSRELQLEEEIDLEDPSFGVKVDFIISYDDLTSVAKDTLIRVIKKIIGEKEKLFVEFFNKSEPLTLKLHALELLPGIGKKTLREILEERKKKPFESFKDIEDRTGIKNIVDIITERIIIEIERKDKYYLFAYPIDHRKPQAGQQEIIYVGYLEKLK
ncbi:RNA-binding protein [Acidianus sp. HS-5]|nr:RNA-binding protein [Acidianus sp. HS-5]